MLQRASTGATWITAPEVSGKAVNINDSYHPLQGFSSQADFTFLLLSSKGKNPAQSKSDTIAGKIFFFFFSR